MKITKENPRKHNRYVKFNLNTQFQKNCNNINQLEFIIYNDDFKLRGHFFHCLITKEFELGWRDHMININKEIIESKRKALENIDCLYTKEESKQKIKCRECMIENPLRFKECEKIIDKSTLNNFVSLLIDILKEIVNRPRFCLYMYYDEYKNKYFKTFLGLCNHSIIMIAIKFDKKPIYNIVTSHVRTRSINFAILRSEIYEEISKKSINEPIWCIESRWRQGK